ncbi:TMAO reductase system periplasmic protein TorT [Vibrio hippocampi]|uniref:Periplasmic protein TorT n=1 Tax=Vibrio hippocampi TaxID=654686 RepID=A0ABM8ZME7_9VIBR|nr:TMAO reductase system periplasmic protein TorT [Vibrio hippocampi]CAH0529567.1 Periplasmic protein TorT [Vibrio hippocampi]
MLKNKILHRILAYCLSLVPAFCYANAPTDANANPNTNAEKLCAIYPHLKDSYWLSVNYGMVTEAQQQNVALKVFESGGYLNLTKQQQQIIACETWGADAILLGTVSPDGYQNNLDLFSADTPVFATVNYLQLSEQQAENVKGVVGVDWYDMGHKVGEYLANKHPKGQGKATLALLPGPKASGGTKPAVQGFLDSIADADIDVQTTLWADNDKELQRNLIQQILDTSTPPDYIAGSAVAIEAAISELRSLSIEPPKLLSIYLSHGVYRGLLRNKVILAPTDQMVTQGRESVKQALHYLRQQPYQTPIAPEINVLTPTNLDSINIKNSLSPGGYRPIFSITPKLPQDAR